MRWVSSFFTFGLALASAAAPSYAKPDKRQAQVQAAVADAKESLRREILAAPMLPDLTVREFLEQVEGDESLAGALGSAKQIGGTRWIDDQTCIIRVELDGKYAAATLVKAAEVNPKATPVPADALARRLTDWKLRTFSATGSSTAAQYIVDVRAADANPAWRGVPPEQSREAVAAARTDAVRRVLDSMKSIPLGEGKSVADALEVPSVRTALQEWLSERPVVGLEFADDLEVRLTISAPAEEIWEVFRTALAAQDEVPSPRTNAEWDRLRAEVYQRASAAVGRSYVADTAPAKPAETVALPADPPAWMDDMMDAQGSARGPARDLKTARKAEDDAARQLREQLDGMVLSPGLTLGEAVKKDPSVGDAVSRSLITVRTAKVNFKDDGVDVRVSFDPRVLWRELHERE